MAIRRAAGAGFEPKKYGLLAFSDGEGEPATLRKKGGGGKEYDVMGDKRGPAKGGATKTPRAGNKPGN